ncbi:Formyl-coenzyme A transferase [Mycobacterium basiliense]|uniref:Formyl-coenzyme A transferase n=1 Tax=Mycobacterium basiliense TaxID=2094119 RepID=A0A3S4BCG1_9MYCO|nr:CoA transferase [Mycobacterium basiliense]VDM86871.1 Formyl-coenzyme A transferase [Mycobacterium basiliense]
MLKPLDGVRVIEFCTVASGPFCGMLLADFGADVIKVEMPGTGDSMRAWPPLTCGYSENFASLNRNKRSIELNLKDPDDNAVARKLLSKAAVVLENSRPGVMEKLGLDYSSVRRVNPRVVYASISAYGQSGPRSREGGFDLTLQAASGIMSVTGEPGRGPVKCGVPLSDFATGLYAAFSISAALREAATSGHGTHIDVSMFGSSLAIAALQTSEYFGRGIDPTAIGSKHPRNAPYQTFCASDGPFAIAAGNDSLWQAMCAVLGREDLRDSPRFASTALRAQNQQQLSGILDEIFSSRRVDELLEVFRKAGIPCAPINTYSQALSDPQVEHMGWVQNLHLPTGVVTKTFGSPIRFCGERPAIYRQPPLLGEHNSEIRAEIERVL